MLASEQNPVLQDDPLVGGSVPRPKEVSPGLSAALWTEVSGPAGADLLGHALQQAPTGGLEPPKHLLLHAVGDGANQDRPRDVRGRWLSVKGAPAFQKRVAVKGREARQSAGEPRRVDFLWSHDRVRVSVSVTR